MIALDVTTLRRLWPKAPQAKIDAICEIAPRVFEEHGIDDQHVLAQLMANISHECCAGTIVRESGNYSAIRIVEIFGSGKSSAAVSATEAQTLQHKPEALFDRVYNLPHSPKLAHELGNHEPGDGYKFRGGGDLQLTGRGSYERIGKMTGHPEILDDPNHLLDPKISFEVAVAEFVALGCGGPAKARNTTLVRRKVNGGTNGLSEVTVWVRKWEDALPDIEPQAQAPRGSDSGEKKLLDSKIMQGTIGTGVTVGGTVLAQVANVSQSASDTVATVQSTTQNVTTVVHAVKPVMGLMPEIWMGIGLACAILAVVGVIYVGWQRWAKLRDQGV
jgi:putative chitinase